MTAAGPSHVDVTAKSGSASAAGELRVYYDKGFTA
jgi:hypothetical protein